MPRASKGKSARQKTQFMSNLGVLNVSNKEHLYPATPGLQDSVPAVEFYAAKNVQNLEWDCAREIILDSWQCQQDSKDS
jgi:hypothetical protein